MSRLEGKVAVITGATGGIGRAAARLFAEEGARLTLVDLDESALREVAQSIGADRASYAVADVTSPEQTQAYVQAAVDRWAEWTSCWPTPGSRARYRPFPTTHWTFSTG